MPSHQVPNVLRGPGGDSLNALRREAVMEVW
jgi:hypothetical protein